MMNDTLAIRAVDQRFDFSSGSAGNASSKDTGRFSPFEWQPEKRGLQVSVASWYSRVTLYTVALGSRICESFGGICHPIETWRTIDRGWQINIWLSCVASGLTSFAVFS